MLRGVVEVVWVSGQDVSWMGGEHGKDLEHGGEMGMLQYPSGRAGEGG